VKFGNFGGNRNFCDNEIKILADEHEAEHVDEQMDNSGVEPHAGDQTPLYTVSVA
jgi:hypothetical protein